MLKEGVLLQGDSIWKGFTSEGFLVGGGCIKGGGSVRKAYV